MGLDRLEPHAYQACALTTWAIGPIFLIYLYCLCVDNLNPLLIYLYVNSLRSLNYRLDTE